MGIMVVHLYGKKIFDKFIYRKQDTQAWKKADQWVANPVSNVQSPCFTSKDWIVRWGYF